MATHGYGYVPDVPDARDFKFATLRPPSKLPASVDLRHLCSPVRDQGQLGSCTGFALAVGLREFFENKMKGALVKLSPLFVYYEERKIENTINQDAGAQIRDGMKVLAGMGCAPETDDPYKIQVFTKAPSAKAVKDATKFKITSYHRVSTVADMQACLADGNGFAMGFRVYASFESTAVAKNGKVPMPKAGEKLLGGHAVFGAGYKMDPKWPGGGFFIVKNSWGTKWGDQGYFYLPFEFANAGLISDSWTALM